MEARAVWAPVAMMAGRLSGEPVTDDEMAMLVASTVPMLEKYGGFPPEAVFVGAIVIVLGPRAVKAAVEIRRKRQEAAGLTVKPKPEEKRDGS